MDTNFKVYLYDCKNCDGVFTLHQIENRDPNEDYCPECGHPISSWDARPHRPALWVTFAAYSYIGRAYGGPEEGGWWYDEWEIIRGTKREFEQGNFCQINEYYKHIQDTTEGKVTFQVYEETDVPSALPERRPIYC